MRESPLRGQKKKRKKRDAMTNPSFHHNRIRLLLVLVTFEKFASGQNTISLFVFGREHFRYPQPSIHQSHCHDFAWPTLRDVWKMFDGRASIVYPCSDSFFDFRQTRRAAAPASLNNLHRLITIFILRSRDQSFPLTDHFCAFTRNI